MRVDTALAGAGDVMSRLSPRQMEITALLTDGKNARQIASILSIGRETVVSHIRVACRKVGVSNRVQLIVVFARWQMIKELGNEKENFEMG